MELREIPFVGDATYRIARDGSMWRVKGSTPRAIATLTLVEAAKDSRTNAQHSFDLVIEGVSDEGDPCAMAQHVTHVHTPFETRTVAGHEVRVRAELQGGDFPLVGDPAVGWACIRIHHPGGDRVHIFHGPSVAAEIFLRDA